LNSFDEMIGVEYIANNEADLEKLEYLDTENQDEIKLAVIEIIQHMIKQQKIIDKNKIFKKIWEWNRQFKVRKADVSKKEIWNLINNLFSDYEIFAIIKKIAKSMGNDETQILLAPDQYIETAEWMISRYHIKRMELDGVLIYFDGQCYSFKSKAFIAQQINICLPLADLKIVKQIFSYIERNSPIVSSDVLEQWNHIKCLENGMYDIKEGRFYETFNAEWIVTNKIPHNFVYSDEINLKIIEDIISDPKEFSVFMDFLSICLYPDIGIYFMVIFLGGGGTGKKQLATFAKSLFGRDNVTNFTIHDIVFDTTDQIIASRSMLNIDEDMSEGEIKEITVILKWVTRDPFSGRGIYSQPINFIPLSRLMANTNRLFDIPDEQHAEPLYDRTHTVILKKKFRKTDEEISDIVKKTYNDSDYDKLITKLLHNAHKLYKSQVVEFRHSTQEEESIWNEFGNWLGQFVKKRMIKVPDVKVAAHDVWLAWNEWADLHDIPVSSPRKFYKKLEVAANVVMTDTYINNSRMNGFYGIRLLTDEEITNIEQENIDYNW
jgi:phage/plasmid-associated DNA primase